MEPSPAQPLFLAALRYLGRAGTRAGGARVRPAARLEAEGPASAPNRYATCLQARLTRHCPGLLLPGAPRPTGHRQGEGEGAGSAARSAPRGCVLPAAQINRRLPEQQVRSGKFRARVFCRPCQEGGEWRLTGCSVTSCAGPTTCEHAASRDGGRVPSFGPGPLHARPAQCGWLQHRLEQMATLLGQRRPLPSLRPGPCSHVLKTTSGPTSSPPAESESLRCRLREPETSQLASGEPGLGPSQSPAHSTPWGDDN